MTQEQLDALVVKWQKILRLQDWNIKAKVRLPTKERTAEIYVYQTSKEAELYIISQDAFENRVTTFIDGYTPEKDTVHELLELLFSDIRKEHDENYTDNRWEQVINILAGVLLKYENDRKLNPDKQ